MKKIIFAFMLVFTFSACAELQTIAEGAMEGQGISNQEISNGLKQALRKGVDDRVSDLTAKNGFYNNNKVKILLPQELQKVESGLRDIGLGSLADEGIKMLNRAAEDAVAEATPIFINAINDMTINDARAILMGDNQAATSYLQSKTKSELYKKFHPIINNSFQKVGADQVWEQIINRYNQIPFTASVNPDLTDYVTNEALDGVFIMVADEEKAIRGNISERSTDLLRKVFALQD
ncbi:MAG: DUF4197 domain-containing protein [Bacteroidota bacterium]